MAGYKIRGPDGLAVRGPDGYAVRRAAITPGEPCSVCPTGTTPAEYQVTSSGIAFPNCYDCNVYHSTCDPGENRSQEWESFPLSGDPNGTFVMTQIQEFPWCMWQSPVCCVYRWRATDQWPPPCLPVDCPGGLVNACTVSLRWLYSIGLIGGQNSFTLWLVGTSVGPSCLGGWDTPFLGTNYPTDADCQRPRTFVNQYEGGCGPVIPDDFRIGGGSATVRPG